MSTSLKKQILDAVAAKLQPLKDAGLVRIIERAVDDTASTKLLPGLQVFDGDEAEVAGARDMRGTQFEFPLVIRFMTNASDIAGKKDEAVPEIQRLVESDRTLGGLCLNVWGGNEQPYVSTGLPVGGADVWYTVIYRRKYGEPYGNY